MSDIAVVHADLSRKGGTGRVCMQTLEALQERHSITLITVGQISIESLNSYYSTEVDESIPVITLGKPVELVHKISENRFGRLKDAALNRRLKSILQNLDFDLVVSTHNEYAVQERAIHYIHFPNFDQAEPDYTRDDLLYSIYDKVCRILAGFSEEQLDKDTIVTNSSWTQNVIKQAYGKDSVVIHPPIDAENLEGVSWDRRENGFVCLGRVTASKKIIRNIKIVEELVNKGYEVHLHIAGPVTDSHYQERVEKEAAKHDFVFIEGEVSRQYLNQILQTHKFGIHGKDYEHFGIAVAEMVAAGMLPIVPDTGGQCEIVGNQDGLQYGDVTEAVQKIDEILQHPEKQTVLRSQLPDVEESFSKEKFNRKLRTIVSEVLQENA